MKTSPPSWNKKPQAPADKELAANRPGRTLSEGDNALQNQQLEQTPRTADADPHAFNDQNGSQALTIEQLAQVFPHLSAEQLQAMLDIALNTPAGGEQP